MKKRIFAVLFALVLCLSLSVGVSADAVDVLYDGADLLTEEQELDLREMMEKVNQTYSVEVSIVTLHDIGGRDADTYVEDYFDDNGYGYGENADGVMLMITMAEREYRILSNGVGSAAISTDDIDYISNLIVDDLSDGNYYDAFFYFISTCEYEIDGEINGFDFPFFMMLIISLAVGFIVALIATGIMRGKLRSVRQQYDADGYTKRGSMKVDVSNELFLYRTLNRVRKAENNSSGNNRARSTGASRNVGGGRF